MKPTNPPASINELMIDRHFATDPITRQRLPDATLTGLEDAMRLARSNAERAGRATAAILSNEMKTMPARQKQAKDENWRLFETASRQLDAAHAGATRAVEEQRKAIHGPARRGDPADVILEGEIRSRLAGMTPDDRRAMLSKALASGDDAVVGAALAGPAMLSGMEDSAEREELRQRWQNARHPAEVDRLARLERALSDVERAGGLLVNYVMGLTDAEIIGRAERLEQEANAATSP